MENGKRHSVLLATCRERVAFWEHTDSVTLNRESLRRSGVTVSEAFISPTYIHIGRERLANRFLYEPELTHICFIDSDNVLSNDTIVKLLELDLPFVGALYFRRQGTPEPVACYWHNKHRTKVRFATQEVYDYCAEHDLGIYDGPVSLPEPHLMEVDAIGFGCTLIRREVFEAIKPPYFGRHGNDSGEDLVFCKLAEDAGYKPQLAIGCQIGHIATYQVTMKDFAEYIARE